MHYQVILLPNFIFSFLFITSLDHGSVNSQYVATVGGIVALTCNISDWRDDIISLMLWYKGNYGAPFIGLDARELPLSQAILSSTDQRMHLNLTSPPSLIIKSIRKSDEGEYKCRVDYRNDRTQNLLIFLKVVGKLWLVSLNIVSKTWFILTFLYFSSSKKYSNNKLYWSKIERSHWSLWRRIKIRSFLSLWRR